MEQYCPYLSPLGPMTLASDGQALTGAWFDGQKYFPALPADRTSSPDLPVFRQASAWLDRYFQGRDPGPVPALAPAGSPFRLAVWDILRAIPHGRTMTYGEIAALLARQRGLSAMSAQAVGGAVGHNPISILIPCHRVVGSGGSLTGYAGGLDRKLALLALEGVDTSRLFRPKRGAAL